MNDARSDGLDALSTQVLECLDRLERGGPEALEAYLTEHPAEADELRRRLAPLQAAGLLEDRAEGVPDRLGEYRLLEPLGGGGMGLVYRAYQESLGREVALKLVRPDQLVFPEARARFRREVAVIARLQHPGIVPVYAFGEERGTPYFAMERVDGATLGEVLSELHGRDPATLTGADLASALRSAVVRRRGGRAEPADAALFRASWPEACARIAIAVARALEHAHASGVLHRDVKPSNVLLSLDGRAMLFDFGLSSSDWVDQLTRSGSVVGSLPYMAPEQVEGRRADRRVDVYGLGVTLHELLCLRPPVASERTLDLRAEVLGGRPPSIRARNPAVARDLAVVCAKAMDRDAERRYPSAAAFARDLENALALRPIEARPAGAGLRLRRWTQRNPARAAAAALAFGLLVVAPVAFAVQGAVSSARLQREVDRAEANLDLAVGTIVDLAGTVGDESLSGLPGIEPVREEVLRGARVRLEQLTPQLSDDPDRLKDRARMSKQLGLVLAKLDRPEEALAAFERAEGALLALRDRDDVPRLDQDLGVVLVDMAEAQEDVGRVDESLDTLERGVAHLRTAVELEPGDAGASRDLAVALQRLGSVRSVRGDTREASLLYDEAVARFEAYVPAAADRREARLYLASALVDASTAELSPREGFREGSAAQRARELLEALVAEDPDDLVARSTLLTWLANHSQPLPGTDPARVEGAARRALALQAEVEAARPYDPWVRRVRVFLLQNLGLVLSQQDRPDEAVAILEEALVEARAEAEGRSDPDTADLLARSLGLLASAFDEAGRAEEAVGPSDEALALRERAWRDDPENAQLAFAAGIDAAVNAVLHVRVGDPVDLGHVRGLLAERLGAHPAGPYLLAQLGAQLSSRAREAGDAAEADALRDRAMADLAAALASGFPFPTPPDENEDFAPLHDHPDWATVVER